MLPRQPGQLQLQPAEDTVFLLNSEAFLDGFLGKYEFVKVIWSVFSFAAATGRHIGAPVLCLITRAHYEDPLNSFIQSSAQRCPTVAALQRD